MKTILTLLAVIFSASSQAQQIEIPPGVVYKYADSAENKRAKELIIRELLQKPEYSFTSGIVFVGPMLWERYGKIDPMSKIKGGDMIIKGYKNSVSHGKVLQGNESFKLVWDYLRSEVANKDYNLRKANPAELKFYWAEISFDIEEPVFVFNTGVHKYIIELSDDFKLAWLEEVP